MAINIKFTEAAKQKEINAIMTTAAETVSQFNAFIKQAKTLLSSPVLHIKPEPLTHHARQSITEFESFIAQAKPILVQQIRAALRAHRRQLTNVCRWVVPESGGSGRRRRVECRLFTGTLTTFKL